MRINAENASEFVSLDYIQNNPIEGVATGSDPWTRTVQSWIKEKGYSISLKETVKLINSFAG